MRMQRLISRLRQYTAPHRLQTKGTPKAKPAHAGIHSQRCKIGSRLYVANRIVSRLQLWKKVESARSTEAGKTGGSHGSRRHPYPCKLYLWLDVLRGQSVGKKGTRVWVFAGHIVARKAKRCIYNDHHKDFQYGSCGGAVSGPCIW